MTAGSVPFDIRRGGSLRFPVRTTQEHGLERPGVQLPNELEEGGMSNFSKELGMLDEQGTPNETGNGGGTKKTVAMAPLFGVS